MRKLIGAFIFFTAVTPFIIILFINFNNEHHFLHLPTFTNKNVIQASKASHTFNNKTNQQEQQQQQNNQFQKVAEDDSHHVNHQQRPNHQKLIKQLGQQPSNLTSNSHTNHSKYPWHRPLPLGSARPISWNTSAEADNTPFLPESSGKSTQPAAPVDLELLLATNTKQALKSLVEHAAKQGKRNPLIPLSGGQKKCVEVHRWCKFEPECDEAWKPHTDSFFLQPLDRYGSGDPALRLAAAPNRNAGLPLLIMGPPGNAHAFTYLSLEEQGVELGLEIEGRDGAVGWSMRCTGDKQQLQYMQNPADKTGAYWFKKRGLALLHSTRHPLAAINAFLLLLQKTKERYKQIMHWMEVFVPDSATQTSSLHSLNSTDWFPTIAAVMAQWYSMSISLDAVADFRYMVEDDGATESICKMVGKLHPSIKPSLRCGRVSSRVSISDQDPEVPPTPELHFQPLSDVHHPSSGGGDDSSERRDDNDDEGRNGDNNNDDRSNNESPNDSNHNDSGTNHIDGNNDNNNNVVIISAGDRSRDIIVDDDSSNSDNNNKRKIHQYDDEEGKNKNKNKEKKKKKIKENKNKIIPPNDNRNNNNGQKEEEEEEEAEEGGGGGGEDIFWYPGVPLTWKVLQKAHPHLADKIWQLSSSYGYDREIPPAKPLPPNPLAVANKQRAMKEYDESSEAKRLRIPLSIPGALATMVPRIFSKEHIPEYAFDGNNETYALLGDESVGKKIFQFWIDLTSGSKSKRIKRSVTLMMGRPNNNTESVLSDVMEKGVLEVIVQSTEGRLYFENCQGRNPAYKVLKLLDGDSQVTAMLDESGEEVLVDCIRVRSRRPQSWLAIREFMLT